MARIIKIAEGYPTKGDMQLFLIQPRAGRTRVICVRKGMLLSILLFFPLFACVFFLGAQYGSRQAQQDLDLQLDLLSSSVAQLRSTAQTDNDLEALALRLGQLQSQLLRLNVIGQRVIEELDIEKDDFDLRALSAMGGSQREPYEKSHRYETLLKKLETFSIEMYDQELQLRTFSDLLTTRELEQETFPAGRPVKRGWMASPYGWRIDPFSGKLTFHSGVDFAAKQGTEVFAVASGLVIWASRDGGYGNLIAIDHGDGYVTRYAHNRDLTVEAGEFVEKGDTIAHIGSTGHSTGPHLHFEVLRNGKKINPEKFVRKAG